MNLKNAQEICLSLTMKLDQLDSMSSEELAMLLNEVREFSGKIKGENQNDPSWKEVRCNALAMEFFIITQHNMLTKGDYLPHLSDED